MRYFAFADLIGSRSYVDETPLIRQRYSCRRRGDTPAWMSVALLALAGVSAFGQQQEAMAVGRPTDWSHHRSGEPV